MALSIYVDVHVPGSISETLRERSLDVLTSQEDGTRTLSDDLLLQRSTDLGRLLLAQDEDFLAIAAEWQVNGREFPGVFFARQGLGIGRIVKDLEIYLKCCAPDELRNRVIHLPIR